MASNKSNKYVRILRSWWGRSLAGAFIGGLVVAFAGIEEPAWFLVGMFVGALALYVVGRIE
jgi:hypothetical protein